MYQPVALFIGLRYMRGEPRPLRAVCFLAFHHRHYAGVMALVTVLSVMNGFEKDLENNILGLMPQALVTSPQDRSTRSSCRPRMQKLQALVTSPQGSVNPQQLPASRCRSCRASRASHR